MSLTKVIPVTKEEGFSFEIWSGLLKTILNEDYFLNLSEEDFSTLLEDYYENNYTINKAICKILKTN